MNIFQSIRNFFSRLFRRPAFTDRSVKTAVGILMREAHKDRPARSLTGSEFIALVGIAREAFHSANPSLSFDDQPQDVKSVYIDRAVKEYLTKAA